MKLLLRWLINAAALIFANNLFEGFDVSGPTAALVAALVLGLLNAIVRPVLLLLTLPINLVTLGLFTFVINALMIWLLDVIVKGVEVAGFVPAFAVAIVMWVVGTLTSWAFKATKEEEEK